MPIDQVKAQVQRAAASRGFAWAMVAALGLLAIMVPATAQTASRPPGVADAAPAAPRSYPMERARWQTQGAIGWAGRVAGTATFARDEGIPTGTMTLNDGVATLTAATFTEGQIDLDIKPLGYNDAGIVFHAHGTDDGEFVYIRANPDCPAAQDCVQYAPVTHGLMGWNIYPNYQAPAPLITAGWNHLTIRVAGQRMQVFVNRAPEPVLDVPRLLALTHEGGIALKGPAIYANLTLRPGVTAMQGAPTPADGRGVVMDWVAAPPTALVRPHRLEAADIPDAGAWHPIEVEPTGLVNLGRAFGAPVAQDASTGWLRTTIDSPTARRVLLHAGFAMQLVVFIDGRPVYRGNNPYYPEEARLSPGGRIGFDNATIPIDLKRGRNEIVFAVGNDWRADLPEAHPSHYGWAAEARLDDAATTVPAP